MNPPNQRNKDALGDTNAPGIITNANAKKELEAFMTDYDGQVTQVTATQKVTVIGDEDEKRIALIKAKVAPDCTNTEFELLMYMSKKYNLDPLLRQIWAVKFGNSPAQIYAGRDGFLEIAHRSGHFDGMKSGTKTNEMGEVVGWCEVHRNDMTHSFYGEVLLSEYNTKKNLWATKPMVMIQKVAESVVLRKAFSVSGLYSPDEVG